MELKFNIKEWSGIPVSSPMWTNWSYSQTDTYNSRPEPTQIEAVTVWDEIDFTTHNRPLIQTIDNTLVNDSKISSLLNGFVGVLGDDDFKLDESVSGLGDLELAFTRGRCIIKGTFIDYVNTIYEGKKVAIIDEDLTVNFESLADNSYYIQINKDGEFEANTQIEVDEYSNPTKATILQISVVGGKFDIDNATSGTRKIVGTGWEQRITTLEEAGGEDSYIFYDNINDELYTTKNFNMKDFILKNVKSIDGNGTPVIFNDNIDLNDNSLEQVNYIGMTGDIDLNNNNLININSLHGYNGNILLAENNILNINSNPITNVIDISSAENENINILNTIDMNNNDIINIDNINSIKSIGSIETILSPLSLTNTSHLISNKGRWYDLEHRGNLFFGQNTMPNEAKWCISSIYNPLNGKIIVSGSDSSGGGSILQQFEINENTQYNSLTLSTSDADNFLVIDQNKDFSLLSLTISSKNESGDEYVVVGSQDNTESVLTDRFALTSVNLDSEGNFNGINTEIYHYKTRALDFVEYNGYYYVVFYGGVGGDSYAEFKRKGMVCDKIPIEDVISGDFILNNGSSDGGNYEVDHLVSDNLIPDIDKLKVGNLVVNVTNNTYAYIKSIPSGFNNKIELDDDIFDASADAYEIYSWENVCDWRNDSIGIDARFLGISVDTETGTFYSSSLSSLDDEKYILAFKDDGNTTKYGKIPLKDNPNIKNIDTSIYHIRVIDGYLYGFGGDGIYTFTLLKPDWEDNVDGNNVYQYGDKYDFWCIRAEYIIDKSSYVNDLSSGYYYANELKLPNHNTLIGYASYGVYSIFYLNPQIKLKQKTTEDGNKFLGTIIENKPYIQNSDWDIDFNHKGIDLENKICGRVDGIDILSSSQQFLWAFLNEDDSFAGYGLTNEPRAYISNLIVGNPQPNKELTIYTSNYHQSIVDENKNPLSKFTVGAKVWFHSSTTYNFIAKIQNINLGAGLTDEGYYGGAPALENNPSDFTIAVNDIDNDGLSVKPENTDSGTIYAKHFMTTPDNNYTFRHKLELYKDSDYTEKIAESNNIDIPVTFNTYPTSVTFFYIPPSSNMLNNLSITSYSINGLNAGNVNLISSGGRIRFYTLISGSNFFHQLYDENKMEIIATSPSYSIATYGQSSISVPFAESNNSGVTATMTIRAGINVGMTGYRIYHFDFNFKQESIQDRIFDVSEIGGSGVQGNITATNVYPNKNDFNFEMIYQEQQSMKVKIIKQCNEGYAGLNWTTQRGYWISQINKFKPYVAGSSFKLAYPKYKLISKALWVDGNSIPYNFIRFGKDHMFTNEQFVSYNDYNWGANLVLNTTINLPAPNNTKLYVRQLGDDEGYLVNWDEHAQTYVMTTTVLRECFNTDLHNKYGFIKTYYGGVVDGFQIYGFVDDVEDFE